MIKITSINFKGASTQKKAEKKSEVITNPEIKMSDTKILPITSDLLSQYANVQLPRKGRNHCVFDEEKVNSYVKRGEEALPEIRNNLQTAKDEKQIVESLYILDRMIDSGVKNIDKMYPVLSNFNDTESPNIQVFLAGIYRKTQVPDAFGPLIKMLIKDSKMSNVEKEKHRVDCPNCELFDPTEEVGGAILEYIRNYSNMPNKPVQK